MPLLLVLLKRIIKIQEVVHSHPGRQRNLKLTHQIKKWEKEVKSTIHFLRRLMNTKFQSLIPQLITSKFPQVKISIILQQALKLKEVRPSISSCNHPIKRRNHLKRTVTSSIAAAREPKRTIIAATICIWKTMKTKKITFAMSTVFMISKVVRCKLQIQLLIRSSNKLKTLICSKWSTRRVNYRGVTTVHQEHLLLQGYKSIRLVPNWLTKIKVDSNSRALSVIWTRRQSHSI